MLIAGISKYPQAENVFMTTYMGGSILGKFQSDLSEVQSNAFKDAAYLLVFNEHKH